MVLVDRLRLDARCLIARHLPLLLAMSLLWSMLVSHLDVLRANLSMSVRLLIASSSTRNSSSSPSVGVGVGGQQVLHLVEARHGGRLRDRVPVDGATATWTKRAVS